MPATEQTFQQIRSLIAQICDIPAETIQKEGRLIGYKMDSIRALDLIVAIEDAFHLTLDKDEMYEVKTVAELCDYVQKHLPA